MIYARRASPLHAARAAAGLAWCAGLAVLALVVDQPILLAALLLVVVAAGRLAGVGEALGRAARLGVPLALAIALVEPLVLRDGLTVLARLGELPVLGRIDVTLEAVAYGGVLGLRALVLVLVFALYAAAVDPDEVLRLVRRRGLRSALTVTVATRMVGILECDARRLAEGQRCRGTGEPSRLAVVRAVAGGALERALDVSAALELRGYGAAAAAARRRAPWSRHDLAFAGSALALLALLTGAEATGAAGFEWAPRLRVPHAGAAAVLAGGLLLAALLPFADRQGIAR